MILYIHGFASCGSGNKVELLKHHFGKQQVLAPDLPVAPAAAMQCLQALIETHDVRMLVGSSLGGFYADCLNDRYKIPCVLINPSTRPFETLKAAIGENANWCSGEPFEWRSGYGDTLHAMYRSATTLKESYLVLLQSADEVLDYRLAQSRYRQHQVIVEAGGSHRFENLADYLPQIDAFFSASSRQKTRHLS